MEIVLIRRLHDLTYNIVTERLDTAITIESTMNHHYRYRHYSVNKYEKQASNLRYIMGTVMTLDGMPKIRFSIGPGQIIDLIEKHFPGRFIIRTSDTYEGYEKYAIPGTECFKPIEVPIITMTEEQRKELDTPLSREIRRAEIAEEELWRDMDGTNNND